MKVAGGIW